MGTWYLKSIEKKSSSNTLNTRKGISSPIKKELKFEVNNRLIGFFFFPSHFRQYLPENGGA